jgi:hypothetical protein
MHRFMKVWAGLLNNLTSPRDTKSVDDFTAPKKFMELARLSD